MPSGSVLVSVSSIGPPGPAVGLMPAVRSDWGLGLEIGLSDKVRRGRYVDMLLMGGL